jgi:hypothetical protein
MRTRNALERLAAAVPAEPSIDSGEEDRILARIVVSDRSPARRSRPIAIGLVLVAAALTVAALAAGLMRGHPAPRVEVAESNGVPLTGARIKLAGYHFRTPAGFAPADACESATPTPPGSPETPAHAMRAAASSDGGCVEAFFQVYTDGTTPGDLGATPVDVGTYQGYYVPQVASSGKSALYVELPQGEARPVYLVLYSEGLTEDQLIAVALSGLPASP